MIRILNNPLQKMAESNLNINSSNSNTRVLEFGNYSPNCAMPNIRLISITCHQPDETDDDEIYIIFQGKKVWPKNVKFLSIDAGENLKIDLELNFHSGWADVELWEYDFWSKNDHLGSFHVKGDQRKGEYTNELENTPGSDRAKYSLHWEILSA